jgi:hypothetical protein
MSTLKLVLNKETLRYLTDASGAHGGVGKLTEVHGCGGAPKTENLTCMQNCQLTQDFGDTACGATGACVSTFC